MKILFRLNPNASKDEVKNSNFQNHYTEINGNLPFSEIAPNIRKAIKKYITPLLGAALYEKLADLADAETPPTNPRQAEVLEAIQDAAANYTIFDIIPSKNLVIASGGIRQHNDEKSTTAPQHALKAARSNALQEADTFLDRALWLISQYANRNDQFFAIWKPELKYGSDFFKRADDLDEFLSISGHRAFTALSRWLRRIEEDELKPILGNIFFDILKMRQLPAPATATDEAHLFRFVQKFVAEAAMSQAAPHLTLILDGDGFKILSSSDGMDEKKTASTAPQFQAIRDLILTTEKEAAQYKEELIAHLYKNREKFPTWQESEFFANLEGNSSPKTVIDTGAGAIFF
jgi:hypothetical protein